MECKSKNARDGLENPEVDRDSKAEETNERSTVANNYDGIRSLPVSAKLVSECSEARKSETSENDDYLLSIGWHSSSLGKSKCSNGKPAQVKQNFRFMPRVLQIHNKNLRVAERCLPKPQEHSSRHQDITVELETHLEDKNMADVQDTVKPDVKFEHHEDPKPAPSSSKSPQADGKINPEVPALPKPLRGTGHKENEDPSCDPYEEFDNCRRHRNCKLTLEEVKRMADGLPACMGIRLRVNYIRQIYKHGRDPDTWNWKQYEDVVPDYTLLLSLPISITKDVPHPDCKVSKKRLAKMSQSLSYSKSRKCFVFLCFYHGLDPDETLKRISENPLVPWVACPEPWRALESSRELPEFPRVKEGYYVPKASSPFRSSTPVEHAVGGPAVESKCTRSNPTQLSQTKEDSTTSQPLDTLPESGIGSAASTASQTRSASETREVASTVKCKNRYKISNSENSVASDCVTPRKTAQFQDSNPKPSKRPLMEFGVMNSHNPAHNPHFPQFNGWFPPQQMMHFPQAQYQSNQYPVAGNCYSPWNGYQASFGAYSPWNSTGTVMYNEAGGGGYSPWNSPAGFDGGSMYNFKSNPYPSPTLDNALNSSTYCSEFTVNDLVCRGQSSGECSSSLNAERVLSDSSAVPTKSAPAGSVATHSTPGLSTGGRPSDSQTGMPLESGERGEDTPERVPLPPAASCSKFLDGCSGPETSFPAPSSLQIGEQPPLPCGSHPPLPADPPPLPPPPPPSPSPSPPPPPPPSSEPEEMDWMELESADCQYQQSLQSRRMHSTSLEAVANEPQKTAESVPKFTIPKFAVAKRTIPKLQIRNLKFPRRRRVSSNGSDVACKDPASLQRTSTWESSKIPEIDPKRRNIPVFVEPADYPHSHLSDEQMTRIENCILDAILDIEKNVAKPVFNESFRRNGRYGVLCSNDFSRKWLYACLGTRKPWPDSNLRLVTKDFTEVKATAVLPLCLDENNKKILRFIEKQNEKLNVGKWEVVRRWETGDFKTHMNLVIDEESAKILEKQSSVIFKMGTGKIITGERRAFESAVSVELKKSPDFDLLEDDIYADFGDETSVPELEKSTEFDSLEHDIYADFYCEKPSVGISGKAEPESGEHPGSASSDRRLYCLRNEYCGSQFTKENFPRRSARERYQRDWSPARNEISKIRKRGWSPKPGGGLCSREDPYIRRKGILEECTSPKRRSRWASRSPPNSSQFWPSQTDRMERSRDDRSPTSDISRARYSRHTCEPRGSPSPCRCDDEDNPVGDTTHIRSPEGSASRLPHRRSQSHSSPERCQTPAKSKFLPVLSFQIQGFTDEINSVFPSPPKIDPWDDFTSASRLLDRLKVEGSDIFGRGLQDATRQSVDGLHISSQSTPRRRVQDVATDSTDNRIGSSDDGLHDSDHESNASSISHQRHLVRSLKDDTLNEHQVEDSHLVERNLHESDWEFKKPGCSLGDSIINGFKIIEDSNPSTSDSHDSDQESVDMSISVECKPGQPLQEVATDQFRKLIAAGYSCEKSLQITQAFVSRHLSASPKKQPEPPKPRSPSPEPTFHKVAGDKFRELIAAGISHNKALEFTQAFVQRQMLPPTADVSPQANCRDTGLPVGGTSSFSLKGEAESSTANTANDVDDQFWVDETQTIDEWVDELL